MRLIDIQKMAIHALGKNKIQTALTMLGIVIGVTAAILLSRFLAALLYGVTPTDALSFLSASLVLLIVALAASYIPARRAASVDPISALRAE